MPYKKHTKRTFYFFRNLLLALLVSTLGTMPVRANGSGGGGGGGGTSVVNISGGTVGWSTDSSNNVTGTFETNCQNCAAGGGGSDGGHGSAGALGNGGTGNSVVVVIPCVKVVNSTGKIVKCITRGPTTPTGTFYPVGTGPGSGWITPASGTGNINAKTSVGACRFTCNSNGDVIRSCKPAKVILFASSCQYGVICGGGICKAPPAPEVVSFSVHPTLVASGNPTTVSWDVKYVSSCIVTGSNGDSWPSTSATEVSKPIVAQTIYTLSCSLIPGAENLDGSPAIWTDQTRVVNVVPKFQEK